MDKNNIGYQVFALKYRPQTFSEVVGQEDVVFALRSAITEKRIHHAYLFSGPRGVGKTSLARILAKALNCIEGPTVNPCGKCQSCGEITRGISLDVMEIDGASNRGIDEIRALREAVKLSPAYCRYKIYIIDEIHMLTQEAFNALLKTLEEPPAHVKFIFATTMPHKVPLTILSRCQKFSFHLLSLDKIINKLERIVKQENIDIDKSILHSIARAGQGSFRDAESLFDQVVPIILEKGNVKDIISFLGIIDESSLNTLVQFIIEKDAPASLEFIQKIIENGVDLGIFLNSLIEHLRNLLICKVSFKTFQKLSYLSPAAKEFILKASGNISVGSILKIMDLLIAAKDLSRKLNSVRIPLELAIIKFSNPKLTDMADSKNKITKDIDKPKNIVCSVGDERVNPAPDKSKAALTENNSTGSDNQIKNKVSSTLSRKVNSLVEAKSLKAEAVSRVTVADKEVDKSESGSFNNKQDKGDHSSLTLKDIALYGRK